jgi:signal transduction histidine kinase
MQGGADKKIRIAFSQSQNKIICTVEDNGIGIRRSEKLRSKHRLPHRSVGLENLQKRIRIMNEKYDTSCSLEITDLKEAGLNGSGTRVVLKFNLIDNPSPGSGLYLFSNSVTVFHFPDTERLSSIF